MNYSATRDKKNANINPCPVCMSPDVSVFAEIPQVPVHCNLLCTSRADALITPRADMRLGFCRICGHIFNDAFNPEHIEYIQDYENSLHFSPRFRQYAETLAADLVKRHGLSEKTIIEIGCGRGDFLTLLCELGGNRGIGFDPSHAPDWSSNKANKNISFIRDFYSERYSGYNADMICCRHVLEHIQFPRDFLGNVRRAINDRLNSVVFFEVPNVMFTLKDLGIWDLIYEHCGYFSMSSLTHLFETCGFKALRTTEEFGGQFLCIESLPIKGQSVLNHALFKRNALDKMEGYIVAFADEYDNKVGKWNHDIGRMRQDRKRVVIWGVGSKGVTFLNTLRNESHIEYGVDLSIYKQGKYVAGTGQKIVPPDFLKKYKPDVVIVMNPIYVEEIQNIMKKMDLSSRVIPV
jgi:SAM-dependent methyltransferase